MSKRPPLGLFPRSLWLELLEVPDDPSADEKQERETSIRAAIDRYRLAGIIPPKAWFDELLLT